MKEIKKDAEAPFLFPMMLDPSAPLYKVIPALGAMDADLSMASGNTHLLAAARTLEDLIPVAFAEAELYSLPPFPCVKCQPHKGLILHGSASDVPGKHPEKQDNHKEKLNPLQHPSHHSPPDEDTHKDNSNQHEVTETAQLIQAVPAYHKAS